MCALLCLSAGCSNRPSLEVSASAARVPVYGLFETTATDIGVAAGNPFDPAQVDVAGEFVAPDGNAIAVPGFAYQGFSRRLVSGREQLSPDGQRLWKVRFTPTAPGRWQWRWRVTAPQAFATSPWQSFEATAPKSGSHGFVRRSRKDARYLRFDDGSPFLAIGENLGWADGRGTFAYDDWLDKLGRQGATYVRVWMPSWGFGLEAMEPAEGELPPASTLGEYTRRLDRAWQLDQVLEQAQRHGIAVMLCIQNHGPFSLTHNSEWDRNPYNQANGGPLAAPQDFFTDPAARELFRRRLRYIVARFAHSPALLAWELWNEVDLTAQYDPQVLAAWHQEMADYLRAIDPHRHLVTTSTNGVLGPMLGIDQALFSLDQIDLAQLHFWRNQEIDFVVELPPAVADYAVYGKPVLVGEAGVDSRGPEETMARDPHASGLHDILWSGIFAGSFGCGMTWWWDNVIDPQDLYFHFGPLASLVSGVRFDEEDLSPAEVSAATLDAAALDGIRANTGMASAMTPPPRNLTALGLQGRSVALIWVKNADNLWYQKHDDSRIEGATLHLPALPAGEWAATWIEPYGGPPPASGSWILVPQVGATVEVPPFSKDIALRLQRIGG